MDEQFYRFQSGKCMHHRCLFIWNGDETKKSGTWRGVTDGQTFACHDSHVITGQGQAGAQGSFLQLPVQGITIHGKILCILYSTYKYI